MDNLPLVHKRWTCHCCPVQIDLKQQNISRKRFPIFELWVWSGLLRTSTSWIFEALVSVLNNVADVPALVYGPVLDYGLCGWCNFWDKKQTTETRNLKIQDGEDVWSSQGPKVGPELAWLSVKVWKLIPISTYFVRACTFFAICLSKFFRSSSYCSKWDEIRPL